MQLEVCNSKFPCSFIHRRALKVLLLLLLLPATPSTLPHMPHNCAWTEVDPCPDRIMKF